MLYDILTTDSMLSRQQIIEKLQTFPDLPVVFMGQFGAFGMVRDVRVTTVRQLPNKEISIINERRFAYQHLSPKQFEKWLKGTEIQVIAIIGI